MPFGGRPLLLGVSHPRCGVPPRLRLAYSITVLTTSGLPCSACLRFDWVGCPLYSGAVVFGLVELDTSSRNDQTGPVINCPLRTVSTAFDVSILRSLIEGSLPFTRPIVPSSGVFLSVRYFRLRDIPRFTPRRCQRRMEE